MMARTEMFADWLRRLASFIDGRRAPGALRWPLYKGAPHDQPADLDPLAELARIVGEQELRPTSGATPGERRLPPPPRRRDRRDASPCA